MILRRLGNKSKIAKDIQIYFPEHSIYIEPFFGAGGMFFNKPKAKYNFLNDLDSDVFNLFQVATNRNQELIDLFLQMPVSSELWSYWKINQETDPLKKALRFLFLSNYGYMGKPDTLVLALNNNSYILLENLKSINQKMFNCFVTNYDFRELLNKISWRDDLYKEQAFIYCDPPYLGTTNNYEFGFKEEDTIDLFNIMLESKMKFAISEFDNPIIIELAKKHKLNIEIIGKRVNMKNRRTEILITNYHTNLKLFV
jgi:DNA adenine methylase